jgi:hypothetical protein
MLRAVALIHHMRGLGAEHDCCLPFCGLLGKVLREGFLDMHALFIPHACSTFTVGARRKTWSKTPPQERADSSTSSCDILEAESTFSSTPSASMVSLGPVPELHSSASLLEEMSKAFHPLTHIGNCSHTHRGTYSRCEKDSVLMHTQNKPNT